MHRHLAYPLLFALCCCGTTSVPQDAAPVDGSSADASADVPLTLDGSVEDGATGDATNADALAEDAPAPDSPATDAPTTDAPPADDSSTDAAPVDPGPYCAAESAFVAQCRADAAPACLNGLAAACPATAAHLSAAARDAVIGCSGHFDCAHDLFDAMGCVDAALTNAPLTSLQETMLTDLCSACNTPAATCLSHSEINGPHRFGAGIVYASDAVLRASGASCIAKGMLQSVNLNCENDAYNCLTDATFGPPPSGCP
jgi:hypothetical protein